MLNLPQIRAELEAIKQRIRNNVPRSGNPEAFHEEKSEIANDLHAIIRQFPDGAVRPPSAPV